MKSKYYLVFIAALAGIVFSVFMIYKGLKKPKVAPIPFEPPHVPYQSFIAAEGIIEACYKNIPLGATFNQIVTDIYIGVGDVVPAGTPLFKTDTRTFDAELEKARAELAFRQTDYENKKTQFSFYQRLQDTSAASEQMYQQSFYELELAQNAVTIAQKAVDVALSSIEQSIIRAPINGQVLQLDIRVGQSASEQKAPLLVFGDTQIYNVRIQIDEVEAWRYTPGSNAVAYVRGNSAISFPLTYCYTEPYIIPKKSLTGSNTERYDTRVLEVIYAFEKNNLPIYVGELLDVYIESQPHENQK